MVEAIVPAVSCGLPRHLPPREGATSTTSTTCTSSTFLHLPSFPERTGHKADKGDSFSGDDPWSPRPGRHLASSPARSVLTVTTTHRSAAQHGSNRIYSFPRVHGVSPSQPCQRPNQRRFETGREVIGHKQRQPRSGMRLASSFCRPWVTCRSSSVLCPLVHYRLHVRRQQHHPGDTIVSVDVCHWGT